MKNTAMVPGDQNIAALIRGWIGEATGEDQRRIGELTAQVQRLQRSRAAAAGAGAQPQLPTNFLDARLGKPPVFRGEETKWQEGFFKLRAYIMCSGDRYPELVTVIEDPGTRTGGHDTLGRRTDPGLATLVSDSGVVDGGSGTPYCASGARLQRCRSTTVAATKVQSSDAGKNVSKAERSIAG